MIHFKYMLNNIKFYIQKSVAQNKWLSPFYPIYMIRRYSIDRLVKHQIISFPKSGRTWVRYFLMQYFASAYGTSEKLSFRTLLKRHSAIPRYQCDHFDFTSSIPELEQQLKSLAGQHVLFLVRDPRDVIVSLYKHSQNRQDLANTQGLSLSDFVRHENLGVVHIVSYMNTCLKSSELCKTFTVVSYEELRNHAPKKSFLSILNFLEQLPVNQQAFDKAMKKSSFSAMKEAEISGSHTDPALSAVDKKNPDSYKVRTGKVGGYLTELSPEDIKYCNKAMLRLDKSFKYS